MTHRTVPLDLLVRVRDALSLAANGLRHCSRWNISDEKSQAILTHVGTIENLLAELTAQHAYWSKQNDGAGILKRYSRPLYTAPQNSVPAWAWRQAFDEWKFDMNIPIAKGADWIESRARALAATPSKSGNIEPV